MRRPLWLLAGLALAGLGACIKFSPFQDSVDAERRDQTAKNLATLAARRRVPVSPEHPLTFAFLSDTHDGYDETHLIVEAINARPDIEVVFHGGDLTDFGSAQEYEWFYEEINQLKAPFVVVTGNHDGLSQGKSIYEQMFGPDNFSFVYADLKFVFFNSNTLEYDLVHPDWPWFAGQLANEEGAKQVVVVTHQPPDADLNFTAEDREYNQQLQRDKRVFLDLYGHVHEDWLVRRDGPVTYFKTQTALNGTWAALTTDGEHIWYETCHHDVCDPRKEGP